MQKAKVIGIVGGGQLGRMLTLAAKPLGFDVIVVDPNTNSPSAQVGAKEITAQLYDKKALKKLAQASDYLTVEIEHLDAATLKTIAKLGTPVNPSPDTIALIQDKLAQKQFLKKAGIPVTDFAQINALAEAQKVFGKFGGKMLIKTRYGAYDGRGNMLVKNQTDLQNALKRFKDTKLYAERYVPFTKELAVMVARGLDGKIITYPVVETVHRRNICLEVLVPADVSSTVQKRATTLAKKVASLLSGAGMFGIEMFLTSEGSVLINEIAPRVHNSGHYSMDASNISQFEQHIRAVTGLPLAQVQMNAPAAVMINILGQRDGPTKIEGLDKALAIKGASVHIYGKSPTKVDRKMGHITVVANDLKKARSSARKARKLITI